MVELVLQQGFTASRAEQASEAMQAVLGVGNVTVGSLGELQYRQWSLVDDGISATHVESSGAIVRVDAAASPDMVVIAVRSGFLTLKQGSETVALQAGDLGLIALDQAASARWEQVDMHLYSFPRASLALLLSADPERLELRVGRRKAVSALMAGLWSRTASTFVEEVLQHPELAESDVVREQAIDALLGLTIEAFGISDAREDRDEEDQTRFDRAAAYMERNLGRPISITDLTRELSLSIRGLQLVFRRTGHGTPQAHLRSMRMAAAQRALTASAPGVAVGDVARRVGYSNLGRFAFHYLDAFGRLPEQDLAAAAEPGSSEARSTPTT